MASNTTDDERDENREPLSYRRLGRVTLQPLIFTGVLLWLAPYLSITVPGVAFSRGSVLAVLACVTRIPDALSIIREERERTAAEKDAFKEFSTRVAALDATEIECTSSIAGTVLTRTETEAGAQVEEVRTAYRNTVMAVSHYEEEYDEPLAENMAEEFGVELATIVDGDDVLTPQLQKALIQASTTARRERASFLQTLDREIDALTDARRQLCSLSETGERLAETPLSQRSFNEVLRVESRLHDLEEDCEAALQDRQRQLQDRCSHGGDRLQEYLYVSQSWTFPVLSDALDCLSRIREVERRIVRTVTRRF